MCEDSAIMEMMEEMEDYFTERDRLFKEREEAYQDRYEALLLRESSLREKEEALEAVQTEHEDNVRMLKEKEEAFRLREADLKKMTELREEEYLRMKKKMQEDQLRINLLETRVQNESLKAQTDRLRKGARMAESAMEDLPVLEVFKEEDRQEQPPSDSPDEEIERLKAEINNLEERIREETGKRAVVEKEKQELLGILLAGDPEARELFEPQDKEEDPASQETEGVEGT